MELQPRTTPRTMPRTMPRSKAVGPHRMRRMQKCRCRKHHTSLKTSRGAVAGFRRDCVQAGQHSFEQTGLCTPHRTLRKKANQDTAGVVCYPTPRRCKFKQTHEQTNTQGNNEIGKQVRVTPPLSAANSNKHAEYSRTSSSPVWLMSSRRPVRCASSRSDSTAHSVPSAPVAAPWPNATRSRADGTTLEGRSAAVRAAHALMRLRSIPNSAGLWPALTRAACLLWHDAWDEFMDGTRQI